MTQDEFLETLEKISDRFDWQAEPTPDGEKDPGGRVRLLIHGVLKEGSSVQFDPLRAVCYAHAGKSFDARSWLQAARALDMPPSDAAELLAAAQDKLWRDVGGDSHQVIGKLVYIRSAMLRATGTERAAGVGASSAR